MRLPRLSLAALGAAGAFALGGCAYDAYGPYGYGYGYGSYGYGYPYGGYGYGYPYGGYGYYGGYGAYDPFGWYGGYYYPGVGIYVYDRYRNRHTWNGYQQHFWMNRRTTWQNHGGTMTSGTRESWSGFNRGSGSTGTTTSGWHHHRN
jgi:hypothetical protein